MLEGLNAAASGMAAQQQRMDALAVDIANANTTGYKRQRVAFRDLLYQPEPWGAAADVRTGSGAAASVIGRGFGQGAVKTTDRPLDVAIEGRGFLEVRRADGTLALTRDGTLQTDARGRLTTASGDLLQPPIVVPRGTTEAQVAIDPKGVVTADGRRIGQLRLVDVTSVDGLQPIGDNLYVPTAASGAVRAATGATLRAGALEGSNVDMADVMVDMMQSQRAYSLASRAITMQDEMLGVANGVKR